MKPTYKTICISSFWICFLICFLICNSISGILYSKSSAQYTVSSENAGGSSLLNSGDWYRFPVPQRGVYKITTKELQDAGINVSALDPKKISIHGYGNGMLPQANEVERPKDLPEVPIYVHGESDGKFDQGDYILFFAEGPDQIAFDETLGSFLVQKNLYADSTFYFLSVDGNAGLRIAEQQSTGIHTAKIKSYQDLVYHEQDLYNILGSGREWYGERFTAGSSVNLSFELPDLITGSDLSIGVKVMSSNASPSSFSVSANNRHWGDIDVEAIPRVNEATGLNTYAVKGKEAERLFIGNPGVLPNNTLPLAITFNGVSNDGFAYLNSLLIQAERALIYRGKSLIFNNGTHLNSSPVTFELANTTQSNLLIWDVTAPGSPKVQLASKNGNGYLFGVSSAGFKEYAAFDVNSLPSPDAIIKVPNQNIRAALDTELLIVVYADFIEEANRLAAFRASHDNLKVTVVTPTQIYNEFSSGRQDVTAIRDFAKHLYDNGRVKYLLLFGKCSYAYKTFEFDNTNFVPTYQSYNSLHPVETYSSDDYFGFLDEEEGLWPEDVSPGDHILDIGIGRLPVKTKGEAAAVVDKIIHYQTNPNTYGSWRNEVVFVADDEDNNTHQMDAERLAALVDTTYTAYHANKIYLGAFRQEGNTSEATKEALNDAIKKGALIINYSGHGNESVWAEERILTTSMINQWDNLDRLPFFVTATCEFGKYDDPLQISGGEQLVLNPKGGAIGLLTTSRPVYSNTNFLLNSALYKVIFSKADAESLSLGDIIKSTKNNSLSGYRNRNFSLLGDPSLKLAFPKKEIEITSITADQSTSETDTLSASSKVLIKGYVTRDGQAKDLNFTGIANITVYDKPTFSETLPANGATMRYDEQNKVLFRGKVSVTEGDFEIRFIVPKNINYSFGKGKLGIYAYDANNGSDAHLGFTDIVIGGSSHPLSDDEPPLITLYMDDESFQPGDITGSNTILLAKIEDDSGINITSNGLNQDLSATINTGKSFVLNSFFENSLNNYKEGWITYPINNLENGNYSISLTAWDINSNFSKKSINFIVASDERIALNKVLNFPNPFYDETTFSINHNRAGDDLEIVIRIYSKKGALVGELKNTYINSRARIQNIVWDGTSFNGLKLSAGVYTYKVIVRSLSDQSKMQEYQRLVLIN